VASSIYLYDQGNLVEEINGSGVVAARYTNTLHIDDRLALARNSAENYYETDGLGTTTSLSSSVGSLTQTYTFDSFGNQTSSSGSISNIFQFTGREYDTETSLSYYRARYYDPMLGRFLSEDPLGMDQGVNFYGYVDNNPINLIDPTGLAKCCATKYQDDIQQGADNARARLNQLFQFGTALLPTDSEKNIGGITGCFDRVGLYHGQRIPLSSQYFTTIKVDPEKHPCDYECAMKHEMVHRRACAALGATTFNALSEKQREVPAYMMELGCYLKMQMDNNLGPYK
jgi:RHS repeat-associated protein